MTASALRRYPRIRAQHPVRVRELGDSAAEEFGATQAIGLGGCSFLSARRFTPGTLVELQIPLAGGMVCADGRVAYALRLEGLEQEIGIEFLRVEPRHLDRIRSLFRRAHS
ncbi:MAG TPA: PilZ domain-containing protein [Thermoanaerobaculia bacterium]|nr:PilZ domain-containing protein [Thermoanaerobaculia bacterium]